MENIEHVRNLWLAVLALACQDALGNNDILKQDAIDWFESEQCEVGSFTWICRGLGIEEEYARETILERVKRGDKYEGYLNGVRSMGDSGICSAVVDMGSN